RRIPLFDSVVRVRSLLSFGLIPFGCVSRSRTFIYNFLVLCTGFCVVYILLYIQEIVGQRSVQTEKRASE
ncbi:uncharacterized protein LOC116802057, partial [Drosophila sechellia]|uniref:uncharacterized protein LOC116802057 n=1 Tax=Drosophila sechellia TaxID=7238 RepID=UPI0013DD98A1